MNFRNVTLFAFVVLNLRRSGEYIVQVEAELLSAERRLC